MFPDVQIMPEFSIKMFKKIGLSDIDDTVHSVTGWKKAYSTKGKGFCILSLFDKCENWCHDPSFLRQGQWQWRKSSLKAPNSSSKTVQTNYITVPLTYVLAWDIMFEILICIFFSKTNQCSLKWHLISSKGNCSINYSKRPNSVDLLAWINSLQ